MIYTVDDTTHVMEIEAGYVSAQVLGDGRGFILAADRFGGRKQRAVHLARCWVVDVEVDGE